MNTFRLRFLSFIMVLAVAFIGTGQSAQAQIVVDAGPDTIRVCSGGIIGFGASVTPPGPATWFGGLGTFDPNRSTLNAIYTPAVSEYGTVIDIVLRSDVDTTKTDTIRIDLIQSPVIILTPAIIENTCPSTSVNLNTEVSVNDTAFTTGFITYWDDGGGSPGNLLGSPIVSPPIGVPTIFFIFKTTDTDPSCFDFEPVTVNIIDCDTCVPPDPTGLVTDATCFGDSSGAVDVTVTGGVGPYTYMWSNAATTEDISGIPAGTYTVTVTDSILCDTMVQFVVTEPAMIVPLINFTTPPVSCKPLSTILLAPNGFSSYLWSNGVTTASTSFIIVSTTDSFTVTVTDGMGCTGVSAVFATRAINPRKLGGSFCGRMDLNTNDIIYAERAWSGPYTTQYEFEIRNKTTFMTNNYISSGRTLDLSTTFVEDSMTYRVRVRLVVDGTPQCWGDSCMIGFLPKSTINPGSLISYDCNKPSAPRNAIIASLVQENGTTNAIQYEYNWYADPGLDTLVASVRKYSRQLAFSQVPGISAGVTYYVTVRGRVAFAGGTSNGGWGPTGTVCSVTPQSVTRLTGESIPDLNEDFTVTAAPNPFDNSFRLYIDVIEESAVDIHVIDMAGRVVEELLSANPMSPIFMGSELSSGVYFVRVSHGTSSKMIKMIKTDY